MATANNLLITLEEAARLINLDVDTSRSSVNVHCPNCSGQHADKRKTLNLNFAKNVFNCPRCQFSGGALDLYAKTYGISLSEAAARIRQNENWQDLIPVKKTASFPAPSPLAPIEVRDKTYRGLLKMLTLTDYHREALRQRGLSDEAIDKGGYKTYPVRTCQTVGATLAEKGYILKGVPGFYKENDAWTLRKMPACLLIPQRDGHGRIQGCQVRVDRQSADHGKYLSLSSYDFPEGTGGEAWVHFVGKKTPENLKKIVLTEGPLKADVISHLTGGRPVLAIPGVNAVGKLPAILEALKTKGLKTVAIAFDMDYRNNPQVKAALDNLFKILEDAGLFYYQLLWDQNYKGLDDWLVSR